MMRKLQQCVKLEGLLVIELFGVFRVFVCFVDRSDAV